MTGRWRTGWTAACLLAVATCLALAGFTQEQPAALLPVRDRAGRGLRLDPQTRTAIQRGLDYLRRSQKESGAIGSQYSVAVTSLAGLAVLGFGSLPERGAYASMLDGCRRYLEGSADRASGFITEAGGESRMHGHCYAVLFLCQLLGSLQEEEDARVQALVRSGVRVIEGAQSRSGGWYYSPKPLPDQDEASVTVCALQALRAARNVGMRVDARRVEMAVRYVESCQRETGVFAYSSRQKGKTSYALSVAALSTLNAAGVYRSPKLARGIEYVVRQLDAASTAWEAADSQFAFYANLYAAQTCYQQGGGLWNRWFPDIRRYLLSKQKPGGSWESRFGGEYATAIAVLILEVPLGYLPIFQR